jgi:hypothetical protein
MAHFSGGQRALARTVSFPKNWSLVYKVGYFKCCHGQLNSVLWGKKINPSLRQGVRNMVNGLETLGSFQTFPSTIPIMITEAGPS